MYVYIRGSDNTLSGPFDFPAIPGVGVQLPSNSVKLDTLLEQKSGFTWVSVDEQPQLVEDNRGTLYSVEDGSSVEYKILGEVPSNLTKEPRPTKSHKWSGSGWVFDPVLDLELKEVERQEKISQVENSRLTAYAHPVTGSDRYFSEVSRLQLMGAPAEEVESVRVAGITRYLQIQKEFPWPV